MKCGLFDRSHPKTPYFLHSAATGSYFLFQFHQQIDHFCHFRWFFPSNSCFYSAHWKIKNNILTQCPLILNQNLASHPWPLIFGDCVLTECPSLWKCEPYTCIHLILECAPPPTRPISDHGDLDQEYLKQTQSVLIHIDLLPSNPDLHSCVGNPSVASWHTYIHRLNNSDKAYVFVSSLFSIFVQVDPQCY